MGKTGPTDVLSFPLDPSPAFPLPPGRRPHLGDIVVSVERAIEQAETGRGGQTGDVRWSPADELRLLVTHGALHICGWDHAEPADETRCGPSRAGFSDDRGTDRAGSSASELAGPQNGSATTCSTLAGSTLWPSVPIPRPILAGRCASSSTRRSSRPRRGPRYDLAITEAVDGSLLGAVSLGVHPRAPSDVRLLVGADGTRSRRGDPGADPHRRSGRWTPDAGPASSSMRNLDKRALRGASRRAPDLSRRERFAGALDLDRMGRPRWTSSSSSIVCRWRSCYHRI